ncbi:NUDIX domain-containing protein [Halobaculum sp. D14]|uniref:NUDIX domain-containing protein n=1 Tax=unclassified Halobaculum TaxID=2640896 RepID=UPI003EBCBC69
MADLDRVDWVPDDVWADVVEYVPVPSVDLVVLCDGGVLLAKRRNEPARGEWFVPGGRIRKGERIEASVRRVAREELGVDVAVEAELGAYDHLYDTADVPDANGKHYVAHGYVVAPDSETFALDDQHDDARVFAPAELADLDLHPNVAAYLADAGVLDETADGGE